MTYSTYCNIIIVCGIHGVNKLNEVTNFIATLGFPVTVASGLCYVMYKVFMMIFSKFIDTLDKLTETNRILAEGVNNRIDKIDSKVDKILDEIKK